MAKKNYEFSLEERMYICDQESYTDTSKNVFMLDLGSNKYTIFAKPVAGSKSAYVFAEDSEETAKEVAENLLKQSQGYSFEQRNKRVLCKPTTSKATIVLDVDGSFYAHAIVKELRKQEVINNIKYNATKGFSLIKKMIGDKLTEEELYASLYDAIDYNIEESGSVVIGNGIYFDAKTAKRRIASDDLHKAIDKATEQYQDTIDTIGY